MKKERTFAATKLDYIKITRLAHEFYQVMIFETVNEETFEYLKYEDTKQVYSFTDLVSLIVKTRYDCDDQLNFKGVLTPEQADERHRFVATAKDVAAVFFTESEDDKNYIANKFEVIKKELKSDAEIKRLELLENAVQELILLQIGEL